jgi:diadenosine tetraphosphatase ApaH/serine/threonine PP2A family protein phosphatase
MFNEIFRYLPLYTIVNDTVFIVHGGLFHDPNVTLQDLECIDRIDYAPVPSVPYPENTVGLEPADERKEYLKQLQRGDSTFSTFHNNIITIFL